MRCFHAALIAALMSMAVIGCSRRQEAPPSKPVRVSATKAFETYFGSAPTTDKGTCYAFVIYFPSATVPEKVTPFPFFTFDEASLKKVAVQRLIGGMTDVKAYRGEILQPFPAGTHLLDISEANGTVTVNFSKELLAGKFDDKVKQALANAVSLTLTQFQGVKDVRIEAEGEGDDFEKLRPTGEAVLQPSAPRLLTVTATKEKGAKDVEEVNAFFDRPVEIKTLQMSGADGKPFLGDVYHSVFDMAAVLKPKDPTIFKAGMPIKIRWDVRDKLGRHAAGETETTLELKEH